jgi:hypothetical protein
LPICIRAYLHWPWQDRGWKFITLGRQRYNKMYVGCMQILEFHSFF